MKKNLTEMVFVLDESGSMASLADDTIGGFNSLVEKQRAEEGEALVSAVFFSNESKVVFDRAPLADIKPLTRRDYVPGGCTALFDAVGGAVKRIMTVHKYAREEDVPEKTVFVITTDGMENASRNYSQKDVKKLVERAKEEFGWEFVFLGANIDAAAAAEDIGVRAEYAVNYAADTAGTRALFDSVGEAISCVRTAKSLAKSSWRKAADEDFASRKSGK